MRHAKLISALLGLVVVSAAMPVWAGSNDVVLHRFGTCVYDGDICTTVDVDERGFYSLARDLGLAFSPPLATTGETLGLAGFGFQIDQTFSVVDSAADYWELGNVNGEPSGVLPVTHLHVRKGLPLSLELGGTVSFLWDSELVAIGTELRWALHEDTLWPVPDLAFRGYVSTILGHSQLQSTVAGAEAVVGLPVGVGNVMNITPYAGYNLAVVVMASKIVDATPLDPRPPIRSENGGVTTQPEFVFDVKSEVVHQGLVGIRFQIGVSNVNFQGQLGAHVQNYTLSYGLEF